MKYPLKKMYWKDPSGLKVNWNFQSILSRFTSIRTRLVTVLTWLQWDGIALPRTVSTVRTNQAVRCSTAAFTSPAPCPSAMNASMSRAVSTSGLVLSSLLARPTSSRSPVRATRSNVKSLQPLPLAFISTSKSSLSIPLEDIFK